MRIVFIVITLISYADGQSLAACRNPSNPGLRIICNNIFGWANQAQSAMVSFGQSTLPKESTQGTQSFSAGLATPLAAGGPPSDKYQCMNYQCVCNFISGARWANGACQLPGGGSLSRQPRQEYRMMTDAARRLYTQGFRAVFSTIYRTLAAAHSNPMLSPGAHSGPSFLPWHRELLKRLEIGIRTAPVNGRYPYWSVTIPYWDNTMDADIFTILGSEPTSSGLSRITDNVTSLHSVMFSNELIGSVQNGNLVDGQFANFAGRQGPTFRQLDRWPGQLLLMSRADVDNIMTTHTVNQVLAATAGPTGCPPLPQNTLELIHGNPHVWVGGNMEQILTSTNDPSFFLHHSFIDFVWEGWRIRRQTSAQRETQYNTVAASCYTAAHRANAQMVPFTGLVNSDGLSNIYTQAFYNYAQRPQCSAAMRNCGSRFLWCYIPGGRCISRVKANEWCRIISTVDPCYRSTCSSRTAQWGRCMPTQRRQGWNETGTVAASHVPKLDKYPYESCFNNNPCCEFLTKNDGCKDPKINTECRASCKVCATMKTYADDCDDRHHLCEIFKKDGFCTKHPDYMAENCRSSCNLCGITRAQDCALKDENKQASVDATAMSTINTRKLFRQEKKPSLTCSNQNICCQYWKDSQGCEKMGALSKQCAAACLCKSSHDLYACRDFFNNCKELRDDGKCKEPEIQENCRNTCGSCPTATALKTRCG